MVFEKIFKVINFRKINLQQNVCVLVYCSQDLKKEGYEVLCVEYFVDWKVKLYQFWKIL